MGSTSPPDPRTAQFESGMPILVLQSVFPSKGTLTGCSQLLTLTYPYLCLPVITGNIAKHIGVLLQANIRKAGTVGTPSVPRTTASSTVGTVGGTGAGAHRVTRSSSLSCVHLPSVVPPVFAVICRPSVFAVIPPSSLSCVICPCRRLTPGRPALSGTSLLSALPAAASVRRRRHLSSVIHPPLPPSVIHLVIPRLLRRIRLSVVAVVAVKTSDIPDAAAIGPVLVLPFARRRRPSTAHARPRQPTSWPPLPRICWIFPMQQLPTH